MPDPKMVERVKVLAESGDPEKQSKAMAWLTANKVEIPAPVDAPAQGPAYAEYEVPPPAKTGGEVAIGHAITDDDDPHIVFKEARAQKNDVNPNLPTASKRASLAAEPYYEGKDVKWNQSPFTYYEPKPENIVSQLTSFKATLPPAKQKIVDEAITSISSSGKDSPFYKEAADGMWREVHRTFKEKGQPVQRLEYAPTSNYRTFVNKVAGNVFNPMLYGADQTMLFGAGSAIAPTFGQDMMSGTSPEQEAVLEDLRARGVLPSPEDARGQEYDPLWSTLGGISGLLKGGSATLGGQAIRAGTATEKAMVPMYLRGTTLWSRLSRAGAGGAVSSGIAGGGVQAVDELTEAAHGGEASLGNVVNKAAGDALVGGIADPIMTGLGMGVSEGFEKWGTSAQKSLREKPGVGEDIRALEQTGAGRTSKWSGVKRTPEAQSIADEALQPRHGQGYTLSQSAEQAAMTPVAEESLNKLSQRVIRENAQMTTANETGYARLKNARVKPIYLFNEILPIVKRRADVPFAGDAIYKQALAKMTDVVPMRNTDPALKNYAQFTYDEVKAMGMDPDALLKASRAKPGGVSGMDDKNVVFAVSPKELTAKGLDEATQGLAAQIKWGKDAGSKDRELRSLYEALVKTRKQFGETWNNTKASHDEILRTRDDDLTTLGMPGKDLAKVELGEGQGLEEKTAAYNAWSQFGRPTTAPSKNDALMNTLNESDEAMRRRPALHRGNEAYSRLKSGQSAGAGDLATKAGLYRSVADGAQLRMDPVFGAMAKGGKAGAKKSAALRKTIQEMVGPGVEIPDSVLGLAAQILSTVRATAGDDK
jgi:hypothetical protein